MKRALFGIFVAFTSLSADAVRVLQTNAAGDNIYNYRLRRAGARGD